MQSASNPCNVVGKYCSQNFGAKQPVKTRVEPTAHLQNVHFYPPLRKLPQRRMLTVVPQPCVHKGAKKVIIDPTESHFEFL